jgi:hypothetical protein
LTQKPIEAKTAQNMEIAFCEIFLEFSCQFKDVLITVKLPGYIAANKKYQIFNSKMYYGWQFAEKFKIPPPYCKHYLCVRTKGRCHRQEYSRASYGPSSHGPASNAQSATASPATAQLATAQPATVQLATIQLATAQLATAQLATPSQLRLRQLRPS